MARRGFIRTVVTAATDTSLVSLEVVKDELGQTSTANDGRLNRYIAEASRAAQEYVNRVFAVETIKDEFWPQRDPYPSLMPGGVEPLQLSTWPIVTVNEVTENGVTLVENTDFRVNVADGQLIRLGGDGYPKRWTAYAIAATYSAGFATIPPDVSGKIARMVVQRFLARGRDPAMMSEDIPGVRSIRLWVPTGSDAGNMPPEVTDVLENYRVPLVGSP